MADTENKKIINGCTLGQYIRSIRNSRNWSTQKVAELSNLSTGYVNKIELDQTTNHDIMKLSQLADTLGIGIDVILEYLGCIAPKINNDKNTLIACLKKEGLDNNSVNEVLNFIEYTKFKQPKRHKSKNKAQEYYSKQAKMHKQSIIETLKLDDNNTKIKEHNIPYKQ